MLLGQWHGIGIVVGLGGVDGHGAVAEPGGTGQESVRVPHELVIVVHVERVVQAGQYTAVHALRRAVAAWDFRGDVLTECWKFGPNSAAPSVRAVRQGTSTVAVSVTGE
jgi:hypothetical protein